MALPSSGQLSIRNINVEIGRLPIQTSLDRLENGTYATINRNSPSYPNSSNPAAISEWYRYDHDAGGGGGTPVTRLNLGYSPNLTFQGQVDACLGEDMALVYTQNADAWWTSTLYESRNGPSGRNAPRGSYSDQPSGGFTVGEWTGTGWSAVLLCVI